MKVKVTQLGHAQHSEIDRKVANDAKTATKNHAKLVRKYTKKASGV